MEHVNYLKVVMQIKVHHWNFSFNIKSIVWNENRSIEILMQFSLLKVLVKGRVMENEVELTHSFIRPDLGDSLIIISSIDSWYYTYESFIFNKTTSSRSVISKPKYHFIFIIFEWDTKDWWIEISTDLICVLNRSKLTSNMSHRVVVIKRLGLKSLESESNFNEVPRKDK